MGLFYEAEPAIDDASGKTWYHRGCNFACPGATRAAAAPSPAPASPTNRSSCCRRPSTARGSPGTAHDGGARLLHRPRAAGRQLDRNVLRRPALPAADGRVQGPDLALPQQRRLFPPARPLPAVRAVARTSGGPEGRPRDPLRQRMDARAAPTLSASLLRGLSASGTADHGVDLGPERAGVLRRHDAAKPGFWRALRATTVSSQSKPAARSRARSCRYRPRPAASSSSPATSWRRAA